LLGLIQGADSVELKLTVPDEDRRSTVMGLGMDPLDAQIRQVVFFGSWSSTKCRPEEAFQVAAETRAYQSGRGVNLSGEQQTKTRTALEYFAEELR
jgi:hypothetical protein